MQVSAADAKRRKQRAEEWKIFRQTFLYSQAALAQTLGCARRTIISIETEAVTYPTYSIQRKFLALKRKHEDECLFRQQRVS